MNILMQNLLELQNLEFDETIRPETEERIAELRAKIPSQILGHYDRLGDKGKKGVAVIRNQVCTGCHMHVPIGTIVELKRGEDVRLCGNCGRYLYVEEIVSKPAEPAPKKPTPKRRQPAAHAV
jgi:predicted  nucleic acid-binding Zn-ribbon protein